MTGKKSYAPAPTRAIADESFSLDVRLLMLVAYRHRLDGVGCFQRVNEMAKILGAHPKSVSRTLTTLEKRGYIERDRHPEKGKGHIMVYRIVYTDADRATVKGSPGRRASAGDPVTEDVTDPVTDDVTENGDPVTENAQSGNMDFQKKRRSHRVAGPEYSQGEYSSAQAEKINSEGSASRTRSALAEDDVDHHGRAALHPRRLAQIERRLKGLGNGRLTADEVAWLTDAARIVDEIMAERWDAFDNLYFQAQRLGSQIRLRLEEDEDARNSDGHADDRPPPRRYSRRLALWATNS
jgi:DNA-binding transcriptional ArsR family regulator